MKNWSRSSLVWGPKLKLYKRLIKSVLRKEKVKGIINLQFIDDEKMRQLNKQFRGKDKPTDVLSFNMDEDGIVGDLAISREMAGRNAKRFGVTYKQEIKRLVIHGALHLCGYDHGPKMRGRENVYQKMRCG